MQIFQIRWCIKPEMYLFAATAILLFPIKWILAWVFAVAVHEYAHYAALRAFGVRVYAITIGFTGAIMKTDTLSKRTETVCALAGPLGGLSLLLLARWMPHVAICALFQSLYNLIPIFPLDGGRALLGLLETCFSKTLAVKIYMVIKFTVLVLFLMLSILSVYFRIGFLPMIFTVMLYLKSGKENILANDTNKL